MNDAILVVGANGFIGSNLIRHLLADGHRVLAYCDKRPESSEVSWIPVSTPFTAAEFATASTILWAAGASTPASSVASPLAEYERNLRPLLAFIESVKGSAPRRLVFLSTGGAIYGDIAVGSAHERSTMEPKSYYSAGKATAEAFLSAWAHQEGHDVTILRPSNVYGAGQPYKPGFGIVPTAFNAIRTGNPVVIRGNGNAVRDYLHVNDLVELVQRVVMRPFVAGSSIYNASSNEATSLIGLFSLIQQTTGRVVPCIYQPSRPFDVDRIVLDNTLARTKFKWQPKIALVDGISDAWAHFG